MISLDPQSGSVKEIASHVTPNDLAVTADGTIFITETKPQRVTRINVKTGEATAADTGITPAQRHRTFGDGGAVRRLRLGRRECLDVPRGSGRSLDAKMPTMTMRLPIDAKGEFKFNEPPPYSPASRGRRHGSR